MRFFFLFLLFSSSFLTAQVFDDFTDSDFTTNPVWTGDSAKWTVINGQLRSNSTIAKDTFYLSTPSTIATKAQWEFYVNLKFATSGSNYTDIYLICDSANLKNANRSGYFVRIGNTKDEICLYKHLSGKNTKIIDGADGQTNTSNNIIKVKVTRNVNNVWRLKRDLTGTGLNYITEGTVTDSAITHSSYFGISVKQSTASFYLKHFYDHINVETMVIDTIAPTIISTTIISSTQLDVLYSEYIDLTTSENTIGYILNDSLGSPSIALRDANNPALVHLTFATSFSDSVLNTLTVSGVQDFNDNPISITNVQFTYYAPVMPVFKDIIINEIFADPSSPVGLPNAEFVEIYNRSTKIFNLNGWLLGDATGSSVITTTNIYLLPQEYLIICKDTDTALYKPFGRVLGMSSFPSLNNTGDNLSLKGSNLLTVDSVNYLDSWYQNTKKKEGGWTLELINQNSSINCPQSANWIASSNINGGTPGAINSVNTIDNEAPKLVSVNVISADSIQLLFNEVIDTTTMGNILIYNINNGVGNPAHANAVISDFKSVLLTFALFLQEGIVYTITINNGIKDCVGNSINTYNSADFVIPEPALANDLVINEILSDPQTGGVDFVEIYNRSNKIIDLEKISISQFDTINNILINKKSITTTSRLIYPQNYMVVSENGAAVKSQYFSSNPTGFIDISILPSMNIASGTVCLSTSTEVIDYFKYNENMQFSLLNVTKGVSLERIDFNRPTQDKTNWHSAAEAVGFATPAYKNSQYNDGGETNNAIEVLPEIFSPDEDGLNDVLNINYRFDSPGLTANITIYDSKGRLVRDLVHNELLGVNGTYSWDGINESREKARIGIYIIFVEAFDLTGKVRHYKKTCVLAGKI